MGYAIRTNPNGTTGWRISDSTDLHIDESYVESVPAPSAPDAAVNFTASLQVMLDQTAQQNGYDNALSCISYEGCGVVDWEADAAAMKAYRTELWKWGYAQQPALNAMTPEQIATLTFDTILAQAPKPEDSGWVVRSAAG